MTSYQVSFAAVMKPHPELARRARTHTEFAVMIANFFCERARLPAFHPRSRNGDPVNRASLYRAITAHFFEAFPAKHLARAGNVRRISKLMGITVLVNAVVVFHK